MIGVILILVMLFAAGVNSGLITGPKLFAILLGIIVVLGTFVLLVSDPGIFLLVLISIIIVVAIVKYNNRSQCQQGGESTQVSTNKSVEENFATQLREQVYQNQESKQEPADIVKPEILAYAAEDLEKIKEELLQKSKYEIITIRNGRRYVSAEVECKYPLTCISFSQYRNQGHPERPMENMYYLTISLARGREYRTYIDELKRLAEKEGIIISDQMVRQYGHPSGGERITELPKRYNSFGRMSESYRFLVVCEVEV